ncbi:MAG TPA: hypothetical protein VHB72_02365 [Candidatus Saccharimonadales bacterium]|nr:hypothetical protein [Candidatus Saccharimonadales bacterium]
MQPNQQLQPPSPQAAPPHSPNVELSPKQQNNTSKRTLLILGALTLLVIIAVGVLGFIFIAKPQYERLQAQTVSNQIFDDVINDKGQDIYRRLSPSDKAKSTEAQMVSYTHKQSQAIIGTPSKASTASYPAKNYAQFIYTVQTTNGSKPFLIDLKKIDGQWTPYAVLINPSSNDIVH